MSTAVKQVMEAAETRTCPQCGSAKVHRSRRRNLVDRTLSLAGGSIRRCHDCRRRQAWFGGTPVVLDLADSPTHRWMDLAVVGLGFFLCVAFGLWISSRLA